MREHKGFDCCFLKVDPFCSCVLLRVVMNQFDREIAEKFVSLCDRAGVALTPENIIKCIGFARQAMLDGECSVEAYYHAKNLLLTQVETANEWIN